MKIAGVLLLLVFWGFGAEIAAGAETASDRRDLLVTEARLLEQFLIVRQRLAELENLAASDAGSAGERSGSAREMARSQAEQAAHLRGLLRSSEIRLVLRLRERAATLGIDLVTVRSPDRGAAIETLF